LLLFNNFAKFGFSPGVGCLLCEFGSPGDSASTDWPMDSSSGMAPAFSLLPYAFISIYPF
jgi:hypothetical protein